VVGCEHEVAAAADARAVALGDHQRELPPFSGSVRRRVRAGAALRRASEPAADGAGTEPRHGLPPAPLRARRYDGECRKSRGEGAATGASFRLRSRRSNLTCCAGSASRVGPRRRRGGVPIEGAAGIGKTRLLARRQSRGWRWAIRVLGARGWARARLRVRGRALVARAGARSRPRLGEQSAAGERLEARRAGARPAGQRQVSPTDRQP
jgi:hypothetical protein